MLEMRSDSLPPLLCLRNRYEYSHDSALKVSRFDYRRVYQSLHCGPLALWVQKRPIGHKLMWRCAPSLSPSAEGLGRLLRIGKVAVFYGSSLRISNSISPLEITLEQLCRIVLRGKLLAVPDIGASDVIRR